MKGISIYSGGMRTLSRVIQGWDKSSLGLLTGNAEIYHLAHVWIAALIGRGYKVQVIDCAIRFNVYRMIDEANLLGVEVRVVLERAELMVSFQRWI